MLKPRQDARLRRSTRTWQTTLREFLNSPLGLWLLSTVFLTFGTWTYSTWSQAQATANERIDRIDRLDQEITNRFQIAGLTPLGLTTPSFERGLTKEKAQLASSLLATLTGPPPSGEALFNDFEKRSLNSLIAELVQLVPSKDERYCLQLALLELAFYSRAGRFSYELDAPDIEFQYRQLAAAAARRWGEPNSVSVVRNDASALPFRGAKPPRKCISASPM